MYQKQIEQLKRVQGVVPGTEKTVQQKKADQERALGTLLKL